MKGRTFEQRAAAWQQGQKFIPRDGAVVVDSVHLRLCSPPKVQKDLARVRSDVAGKRAQAQPRRGVRAPNFVAPLETS